MTNEDFVSYEIAKRLYALDYDLNCEMAYIDRPWNHEHRLVSVLDAYNQQCAYDGTDVYPAPTLSQAQKWLREMKRWHIEVRINGCRNMFCVELWEMKANGGYMMLEHKDGHTRLFDRYEDALSEGISETLKLIEEGEE